MSFRIIFQFGCDYNPAITHSQNLKKLFRKLTYYFTHKVFLAAGNSDALLLFFLWIKLPKATVYSEGNVF